MKTVVCITICFLLIVAPVVADKGPQHRVRTQYFGSSGGNVNDWSSSTGYCCSGTLGAMVVDGKGAQYVLSNNHVLARQDGAAAGEDISQPGLIDYGCQVPPIVADYFGAAKLGSNVDAALGALRPNVMRADGAILDVGVPSRTVRAPAVGLLVAKSGRTTGYTTGKVKSISTTVNVSYSVECGSNKYDVHRYTNQIVATGPKFSAGGDSGSLIVTNDANRQPVALLFAGGGSSTIGNPIGEVLSTLGNEVSKTLSFTGPATTAPTGRPTGAPSDALVEHAKNVKNAHEKQIMDMDGVIGVGVGDDDLSPGEAFIHVYIDQSKGKDPAVPNQIDGVRVKKIKTDPFIAYGCCDKCR